MSDLSNREMEIKLAFLERHVEEQDKVVLGLRKELSLLQRELAALKDRMESLTPASQPPTSAEERPPHY